MNRRNLAALSVVLLCGCPEDHRFPSEETVRIAFAPLMLAEEFKRDLSETTIEAKTKPNIIYIVIDTLRGDRARNRLLMPNLAKLREDGVSFSTTMSAATATEVSFFATFYMTPAYNREFVYLSGWDAGSPSLNYLVRAGYEIRLFGRSDFYACPTVARDPSEPWSNPAQQHLLFGPATSLLARCPVRESENFSESDRFNQAHRDRAYFDEALTALERDHDRPSVSVIYLYGAHSPYSVNNVLPNLHRPHFPNPATAYVFNIGARGVFAELVDGKFVESTDFQRGRNTYDNALISIDASLGAFVDNLKEKGLYDGSLIVLLGDHGVRLRDTDDLIWGAGGKTERQVTDVPIVYKFPKSMHVPPVEPTLGTQMDIFPTIFEAIGLHATRDGRPVDLMRGFYAQSIFKQNPMRCVYSAAPNGSNPPDQIALAIGHRHALFRFVSREASILDLGHPGGERVLRFLGAFDEFDHPVESDWKSEFRPCFEQMGRVLE